MWGRWFGADPLGELAPDLSPYRYAFNNPISFTDPTGMYEGDGGGDWDEENDRDEREYGRTNPGSDKGLFSWTDNARNNDDDVNIFEKPILILLDIINGNFRINFDNIDIRGGGDGRSESDFGHDMSQENRSNDMMNDTVQDAYHNDGPGPRKNSSESNNSNNNNNNNNTGDKPTLEDMKNNPPNHPDFNSPKSGNRKVRNPNGRGTGWVDNKGRVWVPDDHNGTHAPHWDRQEPKGGGYTPMYPIIKPIVIGVTAAAGYIIYKIAVGIATWECGGCGVLLTP